MNKDQISGKTEQVTGKIKQKVGEAVGNQNMANRGMADQVKGAANASLAIKNCHGNGAAVTGGGAGAAQHQSSRFLVATVNDDGLEALPGQALDGRVGIATMLRGDLQIGEHAA